MDCEILDTMTTSHSYVIHINDEEAPMRISALDEKAPMRISALDEKAPMRISALDEEAQLYTRVPEEAPRRKKRCWEPPVFFSLSEFFLSPTKKAKNY